LHKELKQCGDLKDLVSFYNKPGLQYKE